MARQAQMIIVHGFANLDCDNRPCRETGKPCASQEHTYDQADGFSVYRRVETPDDPQQPFDVVDDQDFADLAAAQQYAASLAVKHGLTPDDIEHDT